MNMVKFDTSIFHLNVHEKNITIQYKSSVFVALTFSFPPVAFTFPEILTMFTITCKSDKCVTI